VAYSHVKSAWFPTREAYEAEIEVEQRAREVVAALKKLGIRAKAYRADRYFMAKLLVDQPDLVLNLVDTLRGSDALQTSIPGALELAGIPYTGASMRGLVIGNDRNLVKELLDANDIPTPPFQFVTRRGARIRDDLGLPLIVKLNESGGSVGIDDEAVKETYAEAEARADELIDTYKMPVIVERFISGPEITAVVFEDGEQTHVFCAEKVFSADPPRRYLFTSFESYSRPDCYTYRLADPAVSAEVMRHARRAFAALRCGDYAKFDVRIDEANGTPYFTDVNPNTAFGPRLGLPFTEVLQLHGIKFSKVLASLMTKHASRLQAASQAP
jgi:D-alanine-D-alanine ligase